MKITTKVKDNHGKEIFVGDIVQSVYSFVGMVCCDEDGDFYLSLVCPIEHSCRNARYAFNNGNGLTIIYSNSQNRENEADYCFGMEYSVEKEYVKQ